MDEETAGKIRGIIRRGVIRNINDNGQTQTVSVEVAPEQWRDGVEVWQPHGFTSRPPEDGAMTIIVGAGGDEGDPVALGIANPSARLGGLNADDVAIHTGSGDKFILRATGDWELTIGGKAVLKIPGGMTIDTPLVHITGDLHVDGEVRDHTSTMQTMRDQYNAHGHPDAVPPPGPKMT